MKKMTADYWFWTDQSGQKQLQRMDVFNVFSRSHSEALRKFKSSVKVRTYLQVIGGNPSRIGEAKIEYTPGRPNWNSYIRDYEKYIKIKPGEQWHQYGLYVHTVPKI
jgi:hypothetical protein